MSGTEFIPGGEIVLRYARTGDDLEIEILGADAPVHDSAITSAVIAVRRILELPAAAGARVRLAAAHPADHLVPAPESVADRSGFARRRDLLQMRRDLPVPADHPLRSRPSLPVRAFVPGSADEEAWVRTNNRSFASHPDQGHETIATLHEHLAEPWFDAAGFLVLDDPARPGELAGSCWTKVHPETATDPRLGEIYVIGIDPSHAGEGLGASIVLAGLDHLAALGIEHAVLYVDADNASAVRLYRDLGFGVHARRRVYTR